MIREMSLVASGFIHSRQDNIWDTGMLVIAMRIVAIMQVCVCLCLLSLRIPKKNPDWYAKYNPELEIGVECCSELSISFHYAKGEIMQKLHNYMYSCASKPSKPVDRNRKEYQV